MSNSPSPLAGVPGDRSSRIVRTGLSLLSVQGVTWASSFINVAVLPRFLGAEQFGFGATAWTAVAIATLLAGFGSSNLVVKETARDPGSARSLVLDAAIIRLSIWLAICAAVAWPLLLYIDSNVLLAVLGLSAVFGLVALIQDAILAGLQGLERMGRASTLLAVLSFGGNCASVVILLLGGGIVAITAGTVITATLGLMVICKVFRATAPAAANVSGARLKRMLAAGPPYLAWDLGLKLYGSIDMLLLSLLVGASSVGSYALAYRVVGIPIFITTIITMAVYPSLSASANTDDAWFRKVVGNAARLVVLVTAPMSAGIALLSPQVVDLLSGNDFHRAALLIAILAAHIPLAALHTILGMALFAKDRQRRMAILAWTAAVVNLAGNLILIPLAGHAWGEGAIGAAIGTVGTEVFMGVWIWKWSLAFVDWKALLSNIVRAGSATIVMGAAAFAALPLGFLYAIASGALVYGVACLLTGAISAAELRRTLRHVGSSRGAPAAVSIEA